MLQEWFRKSIVMIVTKYTDIYSGETGRKFKERIKEHRNNGEKHKKK